MHQLTTDKTSRSRQFGLSVGAVLLLIAGWLAWRGDATTPTWLAGGGLLLIVFGAWRPVLLTPLSDAWWALAAVLGYVNARIILTMLFVGVFVPLGVFWRLAGRDPLRLKRGSSGWTPYPARYHDRNHFRRMY